MVWHLREFALTHPKVEVVQQLTAAESEVPRGLRTPIFRILQEATNNVAKHSRASRILVGLETDGGKLSLWVQDDGVGFDPKAAPREAGNGGIGMGSMRERAELSGGTFSVSSAPGAGTRVSAEWPLDLPVSG
jgi:signal transduction histidine kinase